MNEKKYVISVGFSRPKKWKPVSVAIMFAENTHFSHTFVSWKCTFIDRRKVYEAVGGGSRKISNVRFKKEAYITDIFQFEVSEKALAKIDQFTHDQAGTPYGYKHLIGIGIMRIKNAWYKIVGSKKKATNHFKDGKYSQICVESGAYVIELAKGFNLPGNVEDYGLKEFYDFCAKYGEKVPQEKIDEINGKN
jgi:hypothetical protein